MARPRPAPARSGPRLALRLAAIALPVLAVGGTEPSRAADPARQAPAVAIAADLRLEDGRTRVTLVLSRAVEPSAFVLERPDRVVVELPDVNCQLPPETVRRRAGLVTGMRCGLFAIGRTRLVVELGAPATVAALSVSEGAPGGGRLLVLDLVRADRETVRRVGEDAARRDPQTTGAIGAAASDIVRLPVVVVDAGHGGADSGAVATGGAFEKDVVLLFAQSLRDRLEAGGRVRVVMTRDGDVFVPLDERVRLAHAASADLFVSIHGDWIGSPSVRGATVYTGAERASDADAARLAERENAADAAGGGISAEIRAGISDILSELTLRETRGLSHRFAGLVHHTLQPTTRFSAQPRREAGFRVLRSVDMTSVLVELGYLSNATDADLLLSDDWRRRNAAAMAGAIERFFDPRSAMRAAVSP